jgi:fructose-bisphosphate aldolase class II
MSIQSAEPPSGGSSHAMTTRTAQLDQGLIQSLSADLDLPSCCSVRRASRIPISGARRTGIVKIIIGTLLNVAFTQAVRASLASDPDDEVDPRKYLRPAREATTDAVARRLEALV